MRRIIIPILFHWSLFGQVTLLDELQQPKTQRTVVVQDIFKGTRVVNLQSVEMVPYEVLQFMISHRFGAINKGFYTLFGLDEAEIRFDFQYGLNHKVSVGIGRDSYQKTYESFVKVRLKNQSRGNNYFPFAMVYYSAVFTNTEETGPTMKSHFNNRLSFVNQFIIGRKLSENFSFEIVPTFVHRNFVIHPKDNHDTFAIGLGSKIRLNQWVTLNSEYCFRVGEYSELFNNSFSLGFDLETGGHVFQIHLTNSQGMFERAFISETRGDWNTGDIYLGFNLSRPFQMKKSPIN